MRACAVLIVASLAGCASRPQPIAFAPGPVPPAARAEVFAPTPINAGLTPAATLWHLRAALNVAALACRGPTAATITARYNALLARESDRLAAAATAYAAQYQAAQGGKRYDDDMTRLYNFWSQARGREALCAAADAALDDSALADNAAAQLAKLDRGFAPPWIAVDPRVFGAAPVQLAVR